jgi:AmmeMemoRadiSam system protein A
MGAEGTASQQFGLSPDDQQILLGLAVAAVRFGLESGRARDFELAGFADSLKKSAATFVTLRVKETLRGCMGSLIERKPLATDVSDNAFAAAFRDPRFSPLQEAEFSSLAVSIAVLGPRVRMVCAEEEELIRQLRPHVDGVTLQCGTRSATLLPAAWGLFDSPQSFVDGLKRKAGVPRKFWSSDLIFERYETFGFSCRADPEAGIAEHV